MGYSTDFAGCIKIDKPIKKDLYDYINRFCQSRHMTYDVEKLKSLYPEAVKNYGFNGDLGEDGMWFSPCNEEYEDCIVDYSVTPKALLNMLGIYNLSSALWCDYELSYDDDFDGEIEDGTEPCVIQSNGAQKSYNYVEWLRFICSYLLKDYKTNGVIVAMGEESDDRNIIFVKNSEVICEHGNIDDGLAVIDSWNDIDEHQKKHFKYQLVDFYFEPDWWDYEDDSEEDCEDDSEE